MKASLPAAWPARWMRLGALSPMLAQCLPLRQPAVVILSLPRSGSTWVGGLLGSAADALYLHEPLTAAYLTAGDNLTEFPFPPTAPPPVYRQAAALAFKGLPRYPRHDKTIPFPEQWSLARRPGRRVVIKEVNPYLAAWLLDTYAPRLVFLLRHPAAVALSYRKMGWWPAEQPWRTLGRRFGAALDTARQALDQHAGARVITYEGLCRAPQPMFFELFAFASLRWDTGVEARLRQQTTGAGDDSPWSTTRPSQNMIDHWRGQVTGPELAELKAGYLEANLPWYQSPEDWRLAK